MNSMVISSIAYNYMLRKIFTEVEKINNCTQVHDYALLVPPLASAPWCQRLNVARENRTRPVMVPNRSHSETPNTAGGSAYTNTHSSDAPTFLCPCPVVSLLST